MSNMRISGLSSGMDIDQMVEKLMQAQRTKVDKIKQTRQQVEWQRTDYQTVNNSLRTLRDLTYNMKLQGTYLAKKAASSNESAVSATASVTATPGSYTVSVANLAQGLTRGSQNAVFEESNPDGTTKTLSAQFATLPAGNITFTLAGKLGTDGITRNSHAFTIDTTTTTINTLASEINKYSESLGITASYDSVNNRFFLTTNGTGSQYGIGVSADSDSLLSSGTGLPADSKLQLNIQTGAAAQLGQNAQYSFGDASNMTNSTNTVLVNGITLNLKQGGGVSSTITVSRDVDTVYNSIKTFIEKYNTTIDLVNKEISEEKYRDYLPLTDAQKEQLSEKQQEQWEERAKSGMLRNDSYLNGLINRVRSATSTIVSGIEAVNVDGKVVTHSSLASIGIVTGYYTEGGKLYLNNDGADLKRAIEADPDGVMKLFNNNSAVSSEKGIAQRLYDVLDKGMDDIIDTAGAGSVTSLRDNSVFGKKLRYLDNQVAEWDKRLTQMEERYYNQFTAMENALNRLNSQSAWLSQQFGTAQK